MTMTKNVIIADDREGTRTQYEGLIRERVNDVTIEEASDGQILVDKVREKRLREGRYDLILTDYRMPNLDGISAIREIRAFDPATPIYLLSADKVEDEAIKAGATGFLSKKGGGVGKLVETILKHLG